MAGPTAIFLTTTAIEIDEELLNRCLVLSVDESREQTRAIHRLQRERRTLEGMLARRRRRELLELHRDVQRLLRPLPVVNPYALRLTFLDCQTRTRRDHEKYLTLIDAITLLHQHQRPTCRGLDGGETVEYLEVTLEDIEIANRLAAEVLGRSLDELPPQTRRFLADLDRLIAEDCGRLEVDRVDYRFTRRQVAEDTDWSYFQVRKHLDRLVELEYVVPHRGSRGQSFVYELVYDGAGEDGRPFLAQLIDVEALSRSSGGSKSSGKAAAEKTPSDTATSEASETPSAESNPRSLSPSEPSLSPLEGDLEPLLSPHSAPIEPGLSPPEISPKSPGFKSLPKGEHASAENALLGSSRAEAERTNEHDGSEATGDVAEEPGQGDGDG